MATKKQKREAALAKRERYEAEARRVGLEAQRRDQEQRQRQKEKADKEKADRVLKQYRERSAAAIRAMHKEDDRRRNPKYLAKQDPERDTDSSRHYTLGDLAFSDGVVRDLEQEPGYDVLADISDETKARYNIDGHGEGA